MNPVRPTRANTDYRKNLARLTVVLASMRSFLLAGSLLLVSCRALQTISVRDYAQAKKVAAEYVRLYNPRRKQPYWSARLVGPPASCVRLRRTDSTKAVVVLGNVVVLLENGTSTPQPGAIVVIDQAHRFTDNNGNYEWELTSGRHTMRVGGVGFLWSEVPPLRAKQGDSIQLNVQLMPDPRPIIH